MGDVTSEHKLLLSVRYRVYTQYTQYTCVGSCAGYLGKLTVCTDGWCRIQNSNFIYILKISEAETHDDNFSDIESL